MPISLTGLVTGANRLVAGRSRGRTEGEEMQMRREERRRAAERQALQDSLEQRYRAAQIARLNRPEVRNIDPLSKPGLEIQAQRDEEARKRALELAAFNRGTQLSVARTMAGTPTRPPNPVTVERETEDQRLRTLNTAIDDARAQGDAAERELSPQARRGYGSAQDSVVMRRRAAARRREAQLVARRDSLGGIENPAPSSTGSAQQRAWDALPGTAEQKRARVGPRPSN